MPIEPSTWQILYGFILYFFNTLNFWAILVCGIAAMFLGALWYGPVFGKLWMKLMGIDKKKMSKMMKGGIPMPLAYFLMFVGSLLTATLLAMTLAAFVASSIVQALWLTLLLWLGFIMPLMLGSVLWEGKSFKLFFLNNAYQLLNMFVMAVILVSWVKA